MADILVVDDEQSIRVLLCAMLEKDGHTIDTAADGTDAIELLQEKNYDLIITDLHMRRKNGIDVLQTVKEMDTFTEVVILTGYGSISSAVEAMQLGAFVYLTKPIDLQEFRLKVRQALERRNLRKENVEQRKKLQEHREMLERDLQLSEQVQRSIIPRPVTTDDFEVAIRYMPAIGVGGDFSDIYYNDSGDVYLTIVDVTGHGIAAALLVNRVCMEIRRLVREQLEPSSILYQLNDFIVDSFMGTGMFLTMFSCVLNYRTGSLRYSGSAHPPLILWRNESNRFETLEAQNIIIGFEKLEQNSFQQDATIIRPGDKLFLYTDGVIEIEDENNHPLGINGFIDMLRSVIFLETNDVLENAVQGIKQYSPHSQRDDIYLIVLNLK